MSVRDIVCSDEFTLAMTETGDVYSWGLGNLGRLGNSSENSEMSPNMIKFDFKDEVKKIKRTK